MAQTKNEKCDYKTFQRDEFDGIFIKETNYKGVATKNGEDFYLAIKMKKSGSVRVVYFSLDDELGCVSPYKTSRSYVKVKLENDKIITFYHKDDIDCGNDFTLIGTMTDSEFKTLKKYKIKSIRLMGTKYYEDLTKDMIYNPTYFIDNIDCVE
jgi:hypothetical protein